jgi:hypothetical protein
LIPRIPSAAGAGLASVLARHLIPARERTHFEDEKCLMRFGSSDPADLNLEGVDPDELRGEVQRAFVAGLSRATVEALLDALREIHHDNVNRMSEELARRDARWYDDALRSGTLPSNLIALILLKYGARVRVDHVYAEKLGYCEAASACARKLGICTDKLTMVQLDALMRILGSTNPLAEAVKDPSVRPWIRSFLLAMWLLADGNDRGDGGSSPGAAG